MSTRATKDRRVARTDALLREALHRLVHEKPYDEIAVKEILDRANVGRSTFYTHFRDKHELLASGIRGVLHAGRPGSSAADAAGPSAAVLWFARPVFEHIDARRRSGGIPKGARGRHALHEQLRRALVDVVADAIASVRPARGSAPSPVPPGLLAAWIAATFVQVLEWWVEHDPHLPARDADARFRQLVEPSLDRLLS